MTMNIFKELEKGSLPGLKRAISLYPNSVNNKNSVGATPLHIAAGLGQATLVKELLVHGAQHDTTDSQGNIPLHLAAEQGSEETVAELLAGRKTSAKAKNKEGQTPLHLAVLGGYKAVVLKLIEANSRTDIKDKAGNTPLSLTEDGEMLQILRSGKPHSAGGSVGQGAGLQQTARAAEGTAGSQRTGPSSVSATSMASASARISIPSEASLTGSDVGAVAASIPVTPRMGGLTAQTSAPTPQGLLAGTPGLARGRTPPPPVGTSSSGSLTGRLPRSVGSPVVSSGGAGPAGTNGASATAQYQKHDMAIQSLKEGLRAASERLGALDACTAAQLECAGQVEKALDACGNHGRAILDLETRVAFQEERGRDTRVRLERLEESDRDRQDSVKRLMDDYRNLSSQLQRLADQVATNNKATTHRLAQSGDSDSHIQGQYQLQTELAVLRAQMDQLSPAMALATAASAEVRTLAARLDMMQQQFQQQQQHAGGNVIVEQQVLQLQAQVQLLQLPVASLTQQCADLSGRMSGMAEWQQQARVELARLAGAVEQSAGDKLTDAVMGVLDTTARSLNELRQQQDETSRQVALLLQQQAAVPVPSSPSRGPPTLPATPQGSQRFSVGSDQFMGPVPGGSLSRIASGNQSQGGGSRDAGAQAEVRAELESIKSLVADIRKELATEGGSLRREWQRAFSDMQSRYGEQTNELRAREVNIAKLREAALVEEAERRAASGFEEKFSARLGKLETSVEYLTHRLEVLEEQVSGVLSSLAGATSPVTSASPARMAAALALMRSQPATSRSGPGPVSENLRGVTSHMSDASPTVAIVQSALGPKSPLKHDRCLSAAGPSQTTPTGKPSAQSDRGVLRRHVQLHGLRDHGSSCAGGSTTASRVESPREAAYSARNPRLNSEEWWRAVNTEPAEQLAAPAAAGEVLAAAETAGLDVPDARRRTARAQSPADANPATVNADCSFTRAFAELTPKAAVADPRPAALSAPGGLAVVQGQLLARTDLVTARTVGGAAAGLNRGNPVGGQTVQLHGDAACIQESLREGPHCEAAMITQQREASVPVSARGALPSARGSGMMQVSQAGLAGGMVDPANVALGPQLLTPAAHAMLTPSVDIQRLAAAAQQQQQYAQYVNGQAVQAQQAGPLVLPPWRGGQQQQQLEVNVALSVADRVGDGAAAVGTIGPGRLAALSPDKQVSTSGVKSRKEPPLCLFCSMQ